MRLNIVILLYFIISCTNSISDSSDSEKISSRNFNIELTSISFEVHLEKKSTLSVNYGFGNFNSSKEYPTLSKFIKVELNNLIKNKEYNFELVAVSEKEKESRLRFSKKTLSDLLDGSIEKAIDATIGEEVSVEGWLTSKTNFRSVYGGNDHLEFIQDDFNGIGLYSIKEMFSISQLFRGQKIKVVGKRIEMDSNPLIEVVSVVLLDQSVKKTNSKLISPNEFTQHRSLYRSIEVDSISSQDDIIADNQYLDVYNNGSHFRVRFLKSTNISFSVPSHRPFLLKGIVFYDNGWILLPRSNNDL